MRTWSNPACSCRHVLESFRVFLCRNEYELPRDEIAAPRSYGQDRRWLKLRFQIGPRYGSRQVIFQPGPHGSSKPETAWEALRKVCHFQALLLQLFQTRADYRPRRPFHPDFGLIAASHSICREWGFQCHKFQGEEKGSLDGRRNRGRLKELFRMVWRSGFYRALCCMERSRSIQKARGLDGRSIGCIESQNL